MTRQSVVPLIAFDGLPGRCDVESAAGEVVVCRVALGDVQGHAHRAGRFIERFGREHFVGLRRVGRIDLLQLVLVGQHDQAVAGHRRRRELCRALAVIGRLIGFHRRADVGCRLRPRRPWPCESGGDRPTDPWSCSSPACRDAGWPAPAGKDAGCTGPGIVSNFHDGMGNTPPG